MVSAVLRKICFLRYDQIQASWSRYFAWIAQKSRCICRWNSHVQTKRGLGGAGEPKEPPYVTLARKRFLSSRKSRLQNDGTTCTCTAVKGLNIRSACLGWWCWQIMSNWGWSVNEKYLKMRHISVCFWIEHHGLMDIVSNVGLKSQHSMLPDVWMGLRGFCVHFPGSGVR